MQPTEAVLAVGLPTVLLATQQVHLGLRESSKKVAEVVAELQLQVQEELWVAEGLL